MKKIILILSFITSYSYAQIKTIPVTGTTNQHPLSGTIEYRGASGTTAFVDTTNDYLDGCGNKKDLQNATIFSRIRRYIDGSELDVEASDGSGNIGALYLDGTGNGATIMGRSGVNRTSISATPLTMFLNATNSSFIGLTYYNNTVGGYVTANQTALSILHRAANDLRYAPISYTATPSNLTGGYGVTTFTYNGTSAKTVVIDTSGSSNPASKPYVTAKLAGKQNTLSGSTSQLLTAGATALVLGTNLSITSGTLNASGGSSLTAGTGITNNTNTITANLSTGISGGQSVIGGTATADSLTLKANSYSVNAGSVVVGTGNSGLYTKYLPSGNIVIGNTSQPNTNSGGGISNLYNLNIYNDSSYNKNSYLKGIASIFEQSVNSSVGVGYGADIMLSRNRIGGAGHMPKNGDNISTIYTGAMASNGLFNSSTVIGTYATEDWVNNFHGGAKMAFEVCSNNSGTSLQTQLAMTIDQNGQLLLGNGVTVPTGAGATSNDLFVMNKNGNYGTSIVTYNNSNGNAASTGSFFVNDANNGLRILMCGSGRSAAGLLKTDGASIYTGGSGGLNMGSFAGGVSLWSGGNTLGTNDIVNINTSGVTSIRNSLYVGGQVTPTYKLDVAGGDIGIATLGSGIRLKTVSTSTTSSTQTVGKSTLVAGTITITNANVTANSLIFITDTNAGALTNVGTLTVVAGSGSFVVTSTNVLDVSTFNYLIIQPY